MLVLVPFIALIYSKFMLNWSIPLIYEDENWSLEAFYESPSLENSLRLSEGTSENLKSEQ